MTAGEVKMMKRSERWASYRRESEMRPFTNFSERSQSDNSKPYSVS